MLEGAGGLVVIVVVMMVAVGIGAAFGIEGGGYRRHGRIEMDDHVLDHRVAPDAQAVAEELGGQVAVAQVPGDTEQAGRRFGGDFDQRFGCGIDDNDAPVLEHQPVAVPKWYGLGQIEQKLQPAAGDHRHAPAMALVVIEDDSVGGIARPLAGGVDVGCADHGLAIWLFAVSRDTTGWSPRQTAKAMHGILFDKDGTLLDFEATWLPLLNAVVRDLARGDEDVAEAMLIKGGFDPETGRFRAGSTIAAGTTVDVAQLWYPTLDGDALGAIVGRIDRGFSAGGSDYSVALPGVAETLAALAADGHVLGVATNDGTATAAEALGAIGLGGFFAHVLGYDAVTNPKPAPDMVLAFAERTGLKPAEIIVVGDNAHDMVMARQAGAGAAIGVLSGNSAEADLAPFADAILPSICDLPGWLAARG